MRHLRFLYLAIGLGLLAWVLVQAEFGAVVDRLAQMGVLAIVVILALNILGFLTDTASWQLMVPTARLDGAWLWSLWKVRLVGVVFNYIVPAASLGGEPVKAVLLKKRHGIGYHEGSASLVIAKTTNLLAMIAFSAVGLILLSRFEELPGTFGLVAGVGLAALAAGVMGFFAVQRFRVASRIGGWLAGRRLGRRIEKILGDIQDVDERFVDFYHRRPGRFTAALSLALATWIIGVAETYYIMSFLGHPVSLTEAWVIETVVQLVRTGTFFIPANLGTLEAGFMFIVEGLTGQPALGLAAALVRRAYKLLFVVWGLWLGWRYSVTPSFAAAETAKPLDR